MEFTQQGLLEELLAPTRDTWTNFPNDFSNNGWIFESCDENQFLPPPNPPFLGTLPSPTEPTFSCPPGELYPFVDYYPVPEIDSSYSTPIPIQEEQGFLGCDLNNLEERFNGCKVEIEHTTTIPEFNSMAFGGERKNRAKKVEGQPSKNLMAERRRRKRLNDRLLMLRSIVPKISKMDRTSILGDTIDYMKELLEKVQTLREEDANAGVNQVNLMGNFKELKPNEVLVRNSPKFDVERIDTDTRIEISCTPKPGLLLSTVNTLEALGLDVQQCVISCFNDFSMQASCSEGVQQRTIISSQDIKEALFRNSGYGGRCL
ncbi:Transcription factor bHLH93 like [Actinidia chinensis var. chinensis]|uniref:Transcription factor bHLH93 like n=1 Tax=Actinidia chinensis var. chinensis TaxID=1590841 RepID=A0A2R6PA52_ACTCC|nr:Transcription factor bHLH93 like [Actinidia chinensis var. chinensis]